MLGRPRHRCLPDWITLSAPVETVHPTTRAIASCPHSRPQEKRGGMGERRLSPVSVVDASTSARRKAPPLLPTPPAPTPTGIPPHIIAAAATAARYARKRRMAQEEYQSQEEPPGPRDAARMLRAAVCNPQTSPETLRAWLLNADFGIDLFAPDEFGCHLLDYAIQMVARCCLVDNNEKTTCLNSREHKRQRTDGQVLSLPSTHLPWGFDSSAMPDCRDDVNVSSYTPRRPSKNAARLALERLEILLSTFVSRHHQDGLKQATRSDWDCAPPRPLISLLSLAPHSSNTRRHHWSVDHGCSREATSNPACELVFQCARLILDVWPEALHHRATVTGCTTLHVALRRPQNAGMGLVQLLLDLDQRQQQGATVPLVQCRNFAGDLPLHVACSAQVSLRVLQLVVAHTVRTMVRHDKLPATTMIIGSTNHAGLTALDLVLNKYLEGEHGLATTTTTARAARSSTVCSSTVLPSSDAVFNQQRRRRRQPVQHVLGNNTSNNTNAWINNNDSIHDTIWQRFVDQTITKDDGEEDCRYGQACGENSHLERHLLPRIVLLLNASTKTDCSSASALLDTTDLVHRACQLATTGAATSRLHGRTVKMMIPLFLLRYLAWKFPEQVSQPDAAWHKLPLHHALAGAMAISGKWQDHDQDELGRRRECFQWIQHLLALHPDGVQVRDGHGRLPLHSFLSHVDSDNDFVAQPTLPASSSQPATAPEQQAGSLIKSSRSSRSCGRRKAMGAMMVWKTTKLLVQAFPASLAVADPISGLFPCQQMAVTGDLQATFWLLRCCPSVLSQQPQHS